jgi:predicted  nucleic acid-binding Zn-ribbon protein
MTGDAALERAMGKIEGQMLALQQQVAAQTQAFEKTREESSLGRSRIYRELEELRQETKNTAGKIEKVAHDLAQETPVIAEVRRWKERFVGMQIAYASIAAMIGGATVIFWKWIAAKVGM